jgi:hypothetical protein
MVPKHRSQALLLAVLTAVLSACASIDQARQAQAHQDLAAARESCAPRASAGTPAYDACVETQLYVISYLRRRALEDQSVPTQVPSYGPRGELCVPTAAGSNIAC